MRRTMLLVSAVVLSASAAAQSDTLAMSKLFVGMPDSVSPLLTQKARRDMVDFLDNGMEARVRNQLGEEAVLRELTGSYALVETSPLGRMEMKLLPLEGDSARIAGSPAGIVGEAPAWIIAVIGTVRGPAADSHVTFYDEGWHRLTNISFPRPEPAEFLSPVPDSLATAAAYAIATLSDLCPIEIKAMPEAAAFELSIDTSVLTEKEKDAATLLAHPLFYDWDGAALRKRE